MNLLTCKIEKAAERLNTTIRKIPLQLNKSQSEHYKAQIFFKREDLHEVRSFKIRGAYNKIVSLSKQERENGVVCASAGNHAQGVALSCAKLKIKGAIFMPVITPLQKIERVKKFGRKYVTVKVQGNTFDDANQLAQEYALKRNMAFVHAFNDEDVIAGQGTIGKEIIEELGNKLEVVVVPIGGGGLISGIASYVKEKNPNVLVIGVEPEGAACMYASLQKNRPVTMPKIDTFVDGTAVKTPGELTFNLCRQYVDKIIRVAEGQVATAMVELYQNDGIVTEPAGVLTVAALDEIKDSVEGKNVVCIISGGNNDILRYAEILERSLIYQGRKHYFIIQFAQKPGQLKLFVNNVLGPTDDIVRFEYIKKTNLEQGPALVGIELQKREDYKKLLSRMEKYKMNYRVMAPDELLYRYIV